MNFRKLFGKKTMQEKCREEALKSPVKRSKYDWDIIEDCLRTYFEDVVPKDGETVEIKRDILWKKCFKVHLSNGNNWCISTQDVIRFCKKNNYSLRFLINRDDEIYSLSCSESAPYAYVVTVTKCS